MLRNSCRNQRGLCQSSDPRELFVAQLPWGGLVAVSVLLKNRFFRFIWDAWTGVPRNPSLILHHTQINPSVHARCHWGASNLLACFKIDFYLLENLKAPTVQNLWQSCTTDALDKLPTMPHTSEHLLLVSLPYFCHQRMQLCFFGDAFLFHPKLAQCTHLLKEEVLSQVTGHSKLNLDRCSFPLGGKKKSSNTEKLCWGFKFSHQNSTPLQHL